MIPQSEQDIAGALEFTAAWMIRGSGRIYAPPDYRRDLLRYSPYLRELAVRPACCARILSVDAEEEEWPHELIGAFLPIVAELRLPIRAPYQAEVWAELLGEVRLGGGSGEAVEPIPRSAEVEIQFVFEEWTAPEPFAPIVPRYIKVAHVVLDLRHTRPELYDELVGTCDEAFRQFRSQIRPLLSKAPRRRCEARILYRAPGLEADDGFPGRAEMLRLAGAYTIDLRKWRRSSAVVREVAERTLDWLPGGRLPSRAGVMPKTTNLARWWAAAVFDGLTPSQIAASDSDVDTSDQAASDRMLTHVETITTALRRLGVAQPAG